MIEAPWTHRPRPVAATPVQAVLHGTPTTLAEVRALRMQLRATIANGGRPPGAEDDDVDRLLLAFQELVSNGLRHGGSPVRVVVTSVGSGWLVEVGDAAGDLPPVPAVGRDAALGGLGLYLVGQLAAAHGWTAEDDGRKVVWARVDFTGKAAPSPAPAGALASSAVPADVRVPAEVPASTAVAASAPAAAPAPQRPIRLARPTPPVSSGAAEEPRRRRFRTPPRRVSVIVAAVVLSIALGLSWLASAVNANNNQKLLEQQVGQATTVLATQVAVIQTQMADAGPWPR